ncbi:hypothetical protein CSV60_07810 [Sporosarcina sp. P7]|nr:hypothetical protein CSV60_07810 [Sporosarcina sp. P7]
MEGSTIESPARSKQIVEAIRETGGTFITIFEDEILEARISLQHRKNLREKLPCAVHMMVFRAGIIEYYAIPVFL